MSHITPIKETKEVETGYRLETSNMACIRAEWSELWESYKVSLFDYESFWFFDGTACHEAAEFFTMLAEKLEGDETAGAPDVEVPSDDQSTIMVENEETYTLHCRIAYGDTIRVTRDGPCLVLSELFGESVILRPQDVDFQILKAALNDTERYASDNADES